MRINPPYSQDLYFTLKYVAGYWRAPAARSERPYALFSLDALEEKARSGIDALLFAPLPEQELLRERQRLEAKLFGEGRQYTPFL
ncbi:MAG: hypothetical protein IH628_17090 [Proteobacteria bacterium]|nr:hypothetical protein [Pseudomonadota bacterium]